MPPLTTDLARRLTVLQSTPLQAQAQLHDTVTAHLRAIAHAAAGSPFVDLAQATRVAQACFALLDTWPDRAIPDRHLIQAACLYFTATDDEESDLDSIIGFEDDAEVLNHIAHQLGLPDLSVPLE